MSGDSGGMTSYSAVDSYLDSRSTVSMLSKKIDELEKELSDIKESKLVSKEKEK